MTARAAAQPGTLEMQVTPMTLRQEYLMGTRGHRFVATHAQRQVIDTGYHDTVEAAAAAYTALLVEVARVKAARYAG